MILDHPALKLELIKVEQALAILEAILKRRNWKRFDVANLTLSYIPFWIFNFDVYQEGGGAGAQDYSSSMVMNAITGELQPVMSQIMKELPTEYVKEANHSFEFNVESASITKDEVKELGRVKVAGQIGGGKDNIIISGLKMIYIPMWIAWVVIRGKTQKISIDGVSGTPLNIQEVPTRQKTTIEVTQDMIKDLQTPAGWVDYSQKAAGLGVAAVGGAAHAASAHLIHGEGGKITNWLLRDRTGQMIGLSLAIAILLIYILLNS